MLGYPLAPLILERIGYRLKITPVMYPAGFSIPLTAKTFNQQHIPFDYHAAVVLAAAT